MKIEGSFRIRAPRERVWERLLDPETLSRSLPGCEKFEPGPDGSFAVEMRVGIAAIKGRYRGRVEVLDSVPPEHFRMRVEAQGAGGFLRGDGTVRLVGNSVETALEYSGDALVGGVLASVGQRLLLMATKQIVGQFFDAFARQVAPATIPEG